MSEGGLRRAVAEIRFGEERIGITKVGGRSIHQFWSLLSPHFRDVLLAPQRRSDDGGVAWTWREPVEKKPVSAAELAGVRKRLERANDSFAENPVNPLMGEDRGGTSSQALIDQVAAKVKALAESLSAKPDAALAEFVCRTETGIMVHSWGVVSAAQVIYPESQETGIGGVVLTGGKPLGGYEVLVENMQGLSVARTRSDDAGQFRFSKVGQGRYRIRVVSGRVKFPAKGTIVVVERGAVAQVELRSTADSDEQGEQAGDGAKAESSDGSPRSSDTSSPHEKGRRRWIGRLVGLLVLLALLVVGGTWAWRAWQKGESTNEKVVARGSTMAPEDFSAGTKKPDEYRRSIGEGAGLGASADGAGGGSRSPAPSVGRSTMDTHMPAASLGQGRAPSSIGSKIEVQTGVGTSTGNLGASAENSIGDGPAANGTPDEIPVSAELDHAGTNSVDPTTTAKVGDSKRLAGPNSSGQIPGRKAGGAQAPAVEAGALDANNGLPGDQGPGDAVSLTKEKKRGSSPAFGALSSNAQPAGGEALDRINAPGDGPAAAPELDEIQSEKRPVGTAQEKGPVSKVVVVNRGPAPEKKASGRQFSPQEGETAAEEKPDAVAKSVPGTLPAKKSRAGVGPSARNSSQNAPVSSEQTPANDDAASQAPVQERNIQPMKPKAGGARLPQEPSGQEQVVTANLAPDDGAGAKYASYEMEAVRWTVRLFRDAIVPTVPVKIGEVDPSVSAGNQMLAERRGLAPETIRQHATQFGFVISLPKTLSNGTCHWRDEKDSVKRTVDGQTAEIVWTGNDVLRPGVSVLLTADGQEVVSVSVNDRGGIALKVVEGARASLNLGVMRVVSDEKDAGAARRESRFFWQVNGVSRKIQEAKPEDGTLGIGFPLEKAKAPQLEVALADRISGWAVVTRVSIRTGRR